MARHLDAYHSLTLNLKLSVVKSFTVPVESYLIGFVRFDD